MITQEDIDNCEEEPKSALQELLAKVETGTYKPIPDDYDAIETAFSFTSHFEIMWVIQAWRNGSLDAAKELHEAVLPEWDVKTIGQDAFGWLVILWDQDDYSSVGDSNPEPARAWLIAIIKALISKESK